MSRLPLSSMDCGNPVASRVQHPLRRGFALAWLAAAVLMLGGCAGSEESVAPVAQQPEQGAKQLRPPRPYVHATREPVASGFDLRESQLPRGDWQRESFGSESEWNELDRSSLQLSAASALIVDDRGKTLYSKNARKVRPIASVTKLMTAMVVLDSGVSLSAPIRIVEDDRDRLKNSRSRLRVGDARLPRRQMIMVAIMSSDNRAAHALGRTTFRGGTPAFIQAMNRKAKALGMHNTHFVDSSGLNPANRSTAEDLAKMVRAASQYPLIRETTSQGEMVLYPFGDGKGLRYRNTNPLTRDSEWIVETSKTGFINEAGRCLVMRTRIDGRSFFMVFLDASSKSGNIGDSNRVRNWILARTQTASR